MDVQPTGELSQDALYFLLLFYLYGFNLIIQFDNLEGFNKSGGPCIGHILNNALNLVLIGTDNR